MIVQSNNKKNTLNKIIMIIFGVFMLFGALMPFISHGSYMFGGKPKQINEILFEEGLPSWNSSVFYNYKDKFVSTDIDAVVDIYAETNRTYNFIPVGKENHYIVWLDDGSMMSLAISGKDKEIETIINSTWDYLDEKSDHLTDKPLHVEGVIKSLSGDVQKYYDEALKYYGIDESVAPIHYYEIDATESRLLNWVTSIIMLAIGSLLLYAALAKPKTTISNKLENNENIETNDSIDEIENNLNQ